MIKKSNNSSTQSRHSRFTLLDKPVSKPRYDISLSFMLLLFGELVKYSLSQVNQCCQLESQLHEMGVRVGLRVLELFSYREKTNRRYTRVLSILGFISHTCWKMLFGHTAELLKGQDKENEYMVTDRNMILTRYISVPKEMSNVSCAAYVAGIVEGILCSANFPAEVTSHDVIDNSGVTNTTILICFLPEVIQREKRVTGSV